MTTGTLILSFDCEGKWGIADSPMSRLGFITHETLRKAYRTILDLHKKYHVQSTFAFVAALCMRSSDLKDWLNTTRTLEHQGKNWLALAINQISAGITEGWCDEALSRMIRDEGDHELCSHGGTHLPYSEGSTPIEAVLSDISLTQQVFSQLSIPMENLIFPRNIIGFQELLANAGYLGYRNIDSWETKSGKSGKLSRYAAEFFPFDRPSLPTGHANKDSSGLSVIPAAKFLNAALGARKLVPKSMTNFRIESLLKFAIHNNRVVHFYSHPHNFITDPTLSEKLDYMLRIATQHRDQGNLNILTMNQWRAAHE